MSQTLTPSPTPEAVEARKAQITLIRKRIAMLASFRQLIKSVYALPHGSEEHAREMIHLRQHPLCAWLMPWERRVWRHYGKCALTHLHVQLATMRGKVHTTGTRKIPAGREARLLTDG
jgi:hypothetical protein